MDQKGKSEGEEMCCSKSLEEKKNHFLETPAATSQVPCRFTLISVVKFYTRAALEVEGSSPHLICCCTVFFNSSG